MKKKLSAIVTIICGLMIVLNETITIYTQNDNVEKCLDLQKSCSKFYDECLNSNFEQSLAPQMIEKFGIVNHEGEMLYLDGLKYRSEPKWQFVVIYGGKLSKYGEIAERTNRIKFYLFNYSKMDKSRITFINGGFREKFEVELWVSPIKNAFPPLSPTVEAEMVKFRGKMKPLPNVDY